MIHTTVVARYTQSTQPLDIPCLCSSRNHFVPELVRPLDVRPGLFFIYYCFFLFKLSITFLDKCHTSGFNALIISEMKFYMKMMNGRCRNLGWFRSEIKSHIPCSLILIYSLRQYYYSNQPWIYNTP